MKTLLEIQEQYASALNAAYAKWRHAKKESWQICGGHYGRIARGARNAATKELERLEYTRDQINQILRDAREYAELERNAAE